MKLIFLDIDGVIATKHEWAYDREDIKLPSGKSTVYGLNQQCCLKLKRIIKKLMLT